MKSDADFAALEAMPAFLEASVRVSIHLVRERPASGGFCLIEHAWHLADLETEGFGERIRRLLAEEEPWLADFDGDRLARERRYLMLPLEDALTRFSHGREGNLRMLRALDAEAWSRSGIQEGVGRVALREIPGLMAEHDASHRREIDAILEGL